MSHPQLDIYFETVVMPDGQAKFIDCDGVGAGKNAYLTLLEPMPPTGSMDFHMSFNARDSMLFLALHDDGRDLGFSIPVNPAELQVMGQKPLALSAQTTSKQFCCQIAPCRKRGEERLPWPPAGSSYSGWH